MKWDVMLNVYVKQLLVPSDRSQDFFRPLHYYFLACINPCFKAN